VSADARLGRTAREALLSVCCASVEIQRPDNLSGEDYPLSIRLYGVDAQEVNPPLGQDPIHWRLMTTQKQQNPYPPTSLSWATWLIAGKSFVNNTLIER
jgi:hypothetical protein